MGWCHKTRSIVPIFFAKDLHVLQVLGRAPPPCSCLRAPCVLTACVDCVCCVVQTQRAAGAGTTALEVFALTSGLRKKPSFLWGDLHMIDAADEVLSYVRKAHGFTGYLAAFNFGDHAATPDFIGANDQLITEYGKIVATTANVKGDRYVDFKIGNRVRLHGFFLRPNEGVIFQLEDE